MLFERGRNALDRRLIAKHRVLRAVELQIDEARAHNAVERLAASVVRRQRSNGRDETVGGNANFLIVEPLVTGEDAPRANRRGSTSAAHVEWCLISTFFCLPRGVSRVARRPGGLETECIHILESRIQMHTNECGLRTFYSFAVRPV